MTVKRCVFVAGEEERVFGVRLFTITTTVFIITNNHETCQPSNVTAAFSVSLFRESIQKRLHNTIETLQLSAMDILALATMKNAAKCDT